MGVLRINKLTWLVPERKRCLRSSDNHSLWLHIPQVKGRVFKHTLFDWVCWSVLIVGYYWCKPCKSLKFALMLHAAAVAALWVLVVQARQLIMLDTCAANAIKRKIFAWHDWNCAATTFGSVALGKSRHLACWRNLFVEIGYWRAELIGNVQLYKAVWSFALHLTAAISPNSRL